MNIRIILSVLSVCFLLAGCADMDVPTGRQVLKNPLGEGSLRIGMSQDRVRSIYGDPDITGTAIAEGWKESREEWVYTATTSLPTGAGYLSEDLYLYFDGDNLTTISRRSLGRIQPDNEDQ